MKIYSMILIICLIISTGCLGVGYLLAEQWLILPVLLTLLLFWIFTRNKFSFWSASSLLCAYVLLAAIGVMEGLSSILMVVACTVALLCWDLILFNQSIVTNSLPKPKASLEKYHLGSLAVAASAGLMLALLSSLINLHIPFVGVTFLVLMTMGCLLYSVQYLTKKKY